MSALVLGHEVLTSRGRRISGRVVFIGTALQTLHNGFEFWIEKERDGVALAIERRQYPMECALITTIGPDFQHVCKVWIT